MKFSISITFWFLTFCLSGQCSNEFGLNIDSLIIGNWTVEKQLVVPGFEVLDDTNKIQPIQMYNLRVEIREDLILFDREYYNRDQLFSYKLLNSQQPELELTPFLNKKNSVSIKYRIISITNEKMVISLRTNSFTILLNDPFNYSYNSVVYILRREILPSLNNILTRKFNWYSCSSSPLEFLNGKIQDTLVFIYKRQPIYCDTLNHQTEINFSKRISKNVIQLINFSKMENNGSIVFEDDIHYMIDEIENLLYIKKAKVLVYNIIKLSEDQLVLCLNASLTNFYQQKCVLKNNKAE